MTRIEQDKFARLRARYLVARDRRMREWHAKYDRVRREQAEWVEHGKNAPKTIFKPY